MSTPTFGDQHDQHVDEFVEAAMERFEDAVEEELNKLLEELREASTIWGVECPFCGHAPEEALFYDPNGYTPPAAREAFTVREIPIENWFKEGFEATVRGKSSEQ